jgi:hypothetical protein
MGKRPTPGSGIQDAGRVHGPWVQAQPPPPGVTQTTARRAPKARFLEPCRLDEGQRRAICAPLIAAALGDAEGRALFLSAVEYDVALARQAAGARPDADAKAPTAEPAPADSPFADIGVTAAGLAGRLRGLTGPEYALLAAALARADPSRGEVEVRSLDTLCVDLERLAAALLAPAVPPLADDARRFVRRVARAYEQCLEAPAQPEPAGPFMSVLRLLAAAAGLPLPDDPAVIAAVLDVPR